MPVVIRLRGFRFFFYANEGNPREPVHIHVERDDLEAKFWLRPEVGVAYNDGFNARTLRELTDLVEAHREQLERAWLASSVNATAVTFDDDSMWVQLADGRTLGVPLAWFPRLLRATREQRESCRISRRGLHWEALDEDISIAGLLAGNGDVSHALSAAE